MLTRGERGRVNHIIIINSYLCHSQGPENQGSNGTSQTRNLHSRSNYWDNYPLILENKREFRYFFRQENTWVWEGSGCQDRWNSKAIAALWAESTSLSSAKQRSSIYTNGWFNPNTPPCKSYDEIPAAQHPPGFVLTQYLKTSKCLSFLLIFPTIFPLWIYGREAIHTVLMAEHAPLVWFCWFWEVNLGHSFVPNRAMKCSPMKLLNRDPRFTLSACWRIISKWMPSGLFCKIIQTVLGLTEYFGGTGMGLFHTFYCF